RGDALAEGGAQLGARVAEDPTDRAEPTVIGRQRRRDRAAGVVGPALQKEGQADGRGRLVRLPGEAVPRDWLPSVELDPPGNILVARQGGELPYEFPGVVHRLTEFRVHGEEGPVKGREEVPEAPRVALQAEPSQSSLVFLLEEQ